MAQTLADLGFARTDIHLVLDANRETLRRVKREFVESIRPGDLAFVYYSGHGVEVQGANYLLPVDLPSGASEEYMQDEAVSAQSLLREMEQRGADAARATNDKQVPSMYLCNRLHGRSRRRFHPTRGARSTRSRHVVSALRRCCFIYRDPAFNVSISVTTSQANKFRYLYLPHSTPFSPNRPAQTRLAETPIM